METREDSARAAGARLSRRAFFGRATAATLLSAAGCAPRFCGGSGPKLRVGVLSDIHLLRQKDSMHSDVYFEKALRWYDAEKADAVLLCGDIADCGLVAELEYAAEIWNRVFPGGRRSDGEPIKHLFHFGDHDYGGYAHKYPWAKRSSIDPDAPNHALVNEDVVAIWDRLSHEKWEPIQVKEVKGYKFVLAHHPHNLQKGTVIPGLAEALAAANPDPKKPFFFSMHRPVYGTLPEWNPGALAADPNHQALRKYPNVLAFFGHCHRNCADELNLWQGEYTVVHVPSTSYCGTRGGRENSFSCGNKPDKKRPQQMQRVDCFSSNHALFMTVYDDRIVLNRRDVRHDAPMGLDWVIPLPSPDGSCSEDARKALSLPPEFPEGAVATVAERRGKNRAKQEVDQVVVRFPPAHSCKGRPRAYDYEVVASAEGFKFARRVFSTRAYWPESDEKELSECVFGKSELPAGKKVSFTVRPADSYGQHGSPLPSVSWLEGARPVVGKAYPAWSPGRFQIHMIYTGVAESQFLVFPDGTSILIDCGDHPACRRGKNAVPILPDQGRHSGEWIARYVLRVNPRGRDVDYMLLTHHHADHAGCTTFHAGKAPNGKYYLSGFGEAAEFLSFGTAIDRAWPDFADPIPLQPNGVLDNMRPLYEELARRGTSVEKFRLEKGSDQIRPRHGRVDGFCVEPLCSNGRILLPDGTLLDPLKEYLAAAKPKSYNENGLSIGMNFRYGKFTYYTAGDMQGFAKTPDGRRVNLESDMAKAVSAVDVAKLDHHGHESMPKVLVSKLRARVYLAGIWDQLHLTKRTMERLTDMSLYDKGDTPVFVPGILPSKRLAEDAGAPWIAMSEPTCAKGTHVIVDVAPGGERYTVATVAAEDESMTVLSVRDFSSRG